MFKSLSLFIIYIFINRLLEREEENPRENKTGSRITEAALRISSRWIVLRATQGRTGLAKKVCSSFCTIL